MNIRILVVDDEPLPTFLMSSVLEEDGFIVETASSANAAIEIGLEFRPALLICDWLLGEGLDGVDVALALFNNDPHMQTVFLTGLPEEASCKAADQGVPVFRFLGKPCELNEVVSLAKKILGDPLASNPNAGQSALKAASR